MTLGQNIARLRAQRGWSQDALAGELGVSRQSVSKWETDASVPDLDKLMRLSDLFGITLDELVRGEQSASEEAAREQAVPEADVADEPAHGTHRTAGLILLCTGAPILLLLSALGSVLAGAIFALPFLLSALVCFVVKRRTGLWCAWVVFICVDIYLRFATGLSWSAVRQTLLWSTEMNYMRLFVAWGQFAGVALLVLCTLHACRARVVPLTKRFALRLAGGWFVYFAVMPLMLHFLLVPLRGRLPEISAGWTLWLPLNIAYSYAHLALLIVLSHYTIAAFHTWRCKRAAQ